LFKLIEEENEEKLRRNTIEYEMIVNRINNLNKEQIKHMKIVGILNKR